MKNLLLTLVLALSTFRITAQHTKLLDFDDVLKGTVPEGDLLLVGPFMYGLTYSGGTNDDGTIFKIKPDGTGFSKLLDFSDTATGVNPLGSLIYEGTFLYGLAEEGGTNDNGVIFKIKPDGTGFVKLLNLESFETGGRPEGSLLFVSPFLYAMTNIGGEYNDGTIIRIKPDGTGYAKILEFEGVVNGRNPSGTLISDGTFLYGLTRRGGENNTGTAFKIMPDGTGFVKLLDFIGPTNGTFPYGDLIIDGNFLYGMTSEGGANNFGTIFKLRTDGTGYQKLLDFAGFPSSDEAFGNLIFDGTFLFGLTATGGTNDRGTLFKIRPDGTGFVKLLSFVGPNTGSYPDGSLISDGTFFYGTTTGGGTNGDGTIFKYKEPTTAIDELNMASDFTLYPNPTTGKCIFKTGTTTDPDYTLEIFNATGERVFIHSKTSGQTTFQIDLSGYPAGIYLAKIQGTSVITTKRIVLQKN